MKIDGLVWVDAGLLFPGREDGSESGGKWEYAFGNKSRTGSHMFFPPTGCMMEFWGVLVENPVTIYGPPEPTPTKYPIAMKYFVRYWPRPSLPQMNGK
jgi:hypothetical protein